MDFAGGLFPMLFTLRILWFTKSERSSRAVVTLVTSRSDRGVMLSRYSLSIARSHRRRRAINKWVH